MKYEVYLVRYASIIIEAESENDAEAKARNILYKAKTTEEIESDLATSSGWDFDYAEELFED